MKSLCFLALMFISFGVYADPYVWDQPKSYGDGMDRQLRERKEDLRIYTPPQNYGEGTRNQLTEPADSYRVTPTPKSYGEGERRKLYELR
jgi:hypothetical protein